MNLKKANEDLLSKAWKEIRYRYQGMSSIYLPRMHKWNQN